MLKLYNKDEDNDQLNNFKIGLKHDDIEFLKQKRKLNQGFNKVFEYDLDRLTPMINKKRRNAPERKFNEIIEDIIDQCMSIDHNRIFHNPVRKKDFPDYYDKVLKPIDLGTLKSKTKRNEYLDYETFIEDITQMALNSEIYNGPKEYSIITSQAYQIVDLAKTLIESRKVELEENKPRQ